MVAPWLVLLLTWTVVLLKARRVDTFANPINLWKGCPPDKVPGWGKEDGKCCGGGNLQCDANVKRAPPLPLPAAPKVFVGSAYSRAVEDMIANPSQWKRVARTAGLYVHPMGIVPLGERARELYKHFARKVFVIEESITAAFMDRPRHLLDMYINVMKYAEGWRCAGVFLYVESEHMYEKMPDTMAKYKLFTEPIRKMGIPLYFFFTPLDVWNPKNYGFQTSRIGGKPWYVHYAKSVGAAGVALDYPSWHWHENASAQWQPQKYRDLAVEMAKEVKKAGLRFVWCLNGSMKSQQEVKDMVAQLGKRGVKPDTWLVDHFDNKSNRGTPETGVSVTGQAYALLDSEKT